MEVQSSSERVLSFLLLFDACGCDEVDRYHSECVRERAAAEHTSF